MMSTTSDAPHPQGQAESDQDGHPGKVKAKRGGRNHINSRHPVSHS